MIRLLEFFKGRAGSIILFLLATFVVFYFIREHRERQDAKRAVEDAKKVNTEVLGQMSPETTPQDPDGSQTLEWVKENAINAFRPTPYTPPEPVQQTPVSKPLAVPKLIHTYTAPKATETTAVAPKTFAPRGTLIACQLVNTVDSSSLDTPVIGLVTEDVWHNGTIIIPAGVEVHSFAQRGRVRDRLSVKGTWTFIWHDGKEYRLAGLALDREYEPDSGMFGITDGSAGIRGRVHKSDTFLEYKLFASTAIAAVARSAEETTGTILGERPDNSIENGALEGAAAVAERYAGLLLNQVDGDGLFVRAAAGTEFYVYTLGVVEPELASIAGLTQGNTPKASWELAASTSLERNEAKSSPAELSDEAAILEHRDALLKQIQERMNSATVNPSQQP